MSLDPQAVSFLENIAAQNPPQWQDLPVTEGRELFDSLGHLYGTPLALPRIDKLATPDGIPLRLYAATEHDRQPAVVYFHGGGWVLGNLDSHDALCRRLAFESKCTVISVDYRLSPEHRFPVPLEDCYSATRFVLEHAEELGVDPDRLAVAGDSAGGNLAAAVCLRARDENGPAIQLQVLMYPVIEANFDSNSYQEFAAGFGLSKANMIWFWDQYLANGSDTNHPLAAPAKAADLAGLPAAHVITAEYDVLRDEGEAFARQLSAAGVTVSSQRYQGQLHGFIHLSGAFDAAAVAIADIGKILNAHFEMS